MVDKTKKLVEETKAEAAKAFEEAKAETAKVVAEVKEQVKPAVEKAKKRAGRAARAAKETAAKAPAKMKATVEKAAKKAAGETVAVVYVQYQGNEERVEDLLAAAKDAFRAEHPRTKVTDLRLYIKPEERAAYYVVNEKFAGRVDF